jgi:hypothetical protein
MARSGLKKVVKTVKGKKRAVRRVYWVRAANKQPSSWRAHAGDAAGWLTGAAMNQAAAYAGRRVGNVVGGVIGLKLSPFLSPFAVPVGMRVGGVVGGAVGQLAARPFTAALSNYAERKVAGRPVHRDPRKFWLRGSGL